MFNCKNTTCHYISALDSRPNEISRRLFMYNKPLITCSITHATDEKSVLEFSNQMKLMSLYKEIYLKDAAARSDATNCLAKQQRHLTQ